MAMSWEWELIHRAFVFSFIASAALPIGAIIGVLFAPVNEYVVALLMSFGAGALLFAVTIELYGGQLHSLNPSHSAHSSTKAAEAEVLSFFLYIKIIISLGACGIGGWLYLLFNRYLKNLIDSAEMQPISRRTTVDSGLAGVEAGEAGGGRDTAYYKKLNTEDMEAHARMSSAPRVSGRDSTNLLGIRGSVNIVRPTSEVRKKSSFLSSQSDFQERRRARGTVLQMALAQTINEEEEDEAEFEDYGTMTPLSRKAEDTTSESPLIKEDESKRKETPAKKSALKPSKTAEFVAAQHETRKKTLAFSIICGVIVDGISEGGLIAFLAAHKNLSVDFVFSVFLANFPEALCSASMLASCYRGKSQKTYSLMIVFSWFCMSLVTASLSGIVAFFLTTVHDINSLGMQIGTGFVEGLAAGSMLMMVLSVMIPEAFEVAHDYSSIMMIIGFIVSITATVAFGYVEDFGSYAIPEQVKAHFFLSREIT